MSNNRYPEIQAIVEALAPDLEKFYVKGNNSAGTRVRKGLLELAALCKELRKDVTEIKNSRKEQV